MELTKNRELDGAARSCLSLQRGRANIIATFGRRLVDLSDDDFFNKVDVEVKSLFHTIYMIAKAAWLERDDRWAEMLDKARQLIRENLERELTGKHLVFFEQHLSGNLENFTEEMDDLSLAVLEWLRIDTAECAHLDDPLSVEVAKGVVLEHTLYQLRGSCDEDRREADAIEACINENRVVSAQNARSASAFLLDQFLTVEMMHKKYQWDDCDTSNTSRSAEVENV